MRDAGGVDGTFARWRVRAGYRSDSEDVPGPAGPFDQTFISAADITIVEPVAPAIRHRLETLTLTAFTGLPGEWIILVIDRAAPTGPEYTQDLYLNVVSFKHGVI